MPDNDYDKDHQLLNRQDDTPRPNPSHDATGSEASSPGKDLYSPGNLAEKESSPDTSDTDLKDSPLGKQDTATGSGQPDYYNAAAKPSKLSTVKGRLGGVKSFSKKKVLIIMGPVVLIIIILILMSLLKIPNYAENILAYRLARSAMEYGETTAQIDGEKIAVDAADDSAWKAIADKFGLTDKIKNLRDSTIGRFDDYRPKKVYENMKAEGRIAYTTEERTILGISVSPRITGVSIDRIPIDLSEMKFGNTWTKFKAKLSVSSDISAVIDDSLQTSKSWVRGGVAKQIRADLGINLQWWKRKGADFLGLSAEDADIQQLKDAREKLSKIPNTEAMTDELNKARDEVKKAEDNCIAKRECAKRMATEEEMQPEIADALTASTKETFATKIMGALNTAYAIAVPLCLIFDGSMVHSGGDIDAQSASATASFYAVATAADQQKAGDTTAEAVGAMDRKIGTGDSVPDQIGRGVTPDTSVEKSPQSNVLGDFTLANALIKSKTASDAINTFAGKVCPVLTDIKFMIAFTAAWTVLRIVLGAVTGGGATTADVGIGEAIKAALKNAVEHALGGILEKIATKAGWLAIKDSAKGFAKKFAAQFAGIELFTIAAKLFVLSRVGMINDGATANNGSFKDEADMGADLVNNEQSRKMLYGAAMTDKNVALNDIEIASYLDNKERMKPVFERYFATSNPRSIISRISCQLAYVKNVGFLKSFYKFIGSINFSTLSNIFFPVNKHVLAADASSTVHYGIVQWGWTNEEKNIINNDASYNVLENAKILADSNQATNIEADYGKCYSSTMGTLLSQGFIQRTDTGDVIEDKGDCSPQNLGPDNPKYGRMVLRWRLDKKYNNVLEQNIGIQEPTADEVINTGGRSGPWVGGDSTNIPCAEGTTDNGVAVGYFEGNPVNIRICNVQGVVVNSQISGITNNMITTAKGSGINLGGGGFRTMAEQEAARRKNCTDYLDSTTCNPPTATPGWSNHQMGVAIDFTCDGTLIGSHGDKCFVWLSSNAGSYGFINLPSEPWHWSAGPNAGH